MSVIAGRDYVPVLEIVTFTSEEIKKIVEIFIIDDKNIEYDERFFLYLTSGEGVHLSPFSTAEVVIKNDDGENINIYYYIYAFLRCACAKDHARHSKARMSFS